MCLGMGLGLFAEHTMHNMVFEEKTLKSELEQFNFIKTTTIPTKTIIQHINCVKNKLYGRF